MADLTLRASHGYRRFILRGETARTSGERLAVPEDAVAFYRSLLARDPHLAAVRGALAQALLDHGEPEAAVVEATAALGRDPSLVPAWLVRAAANKALCAYEPAARDFSAAAALSPGRHLILVNLANCLAEAGRLGDAAHHLRRAIAMVPTCKEAQASLGSVLVRRGELAQAEAPCRAALALDGGMITAHQNLSAILATRDPAAARAHRDAAYRAQQVFVEPAARPDRRILVLSAADQANVPLQHLFPRARTTLIRWYVEYATQDQDRALPPFDLIFNAIGDADFAPPIARPVARLLQTQGRRVLNHPSCVARTRRCATPALLSGLADVVIPRVIDIDTASTDAATAAAAADIQLPILARPVGSHGGDDLRRIDETAGLTGLPPRRTYLTAFVDFRSDDGYYRKYRCIFIDGAVYPYHLAIARHWRVHYWTAGMEADCERRAEERRFLADPGGVIGARAMTALERIAERLGLDFAGIDFAMLPDGRILVFEANATMLVHPESDDVLAYRNDAVEAIQAAFDAMISRRIASCAP